MIEIRNKMTIIYIVISFFTFFSQCKKKPVVSNDPTIFRFDGEFTTNDEKVFKLNQTVVKLFPDNLNHVEIFTNNEKIINLNEEVSCNTDAVGTSIYQYKNLEDPHLRIILIEDYQDILTGSIYAVLISKNTLVRTFKFCDIQYNYEKYTIKDILSITKNNNKISFNFDHNKIEKREKNTKSTFTFSINPPKNNSTHDSLVTSKPSISESNPINAKNISLLSDLKGLWAVNCQNELTELDINKEKGSLSLYSPNEIYIDIKVEKSETENEYILYFNKTTWQKDYYKDLLNIVDEYIDKSKPIGKLKIMDGGKAKLDWIGLYNTKKRKLEFVGDDFLLIKENGGKIPLILERCD